MPGIMNGYLVVFVFSSDLADCPDLILSMLFLFVLFLISLVLCTCGTQEFKFGKSVLCFYKVGAGIKLSLSVDSRFLDPPWSSC